MDNLALVLLSIGLAMDAFAVSICKGLAMKTPPLKSMLIIGLWFGAFQGLMPLIGYFLGDAVYDYIADFDHWIAFGLLAFIGFNMVREALSDEEEDPDADISFRTMLILAIATSIDALAVGISLAMDDTPILTAALTIGIITMAISMAGVKIGSLFGDKYGKRAELVGGIILIGLGVKILLEHLGLL